MPFAGFENFDACVIQMIAEGHSEEDARKICGKLQAEAEMGDFSNQWIEIFRAGNYGPKGDWPPERVRKVVENFDPKTWQPPAVLGHPANDAPAMGLVRELKEEGGRLFARFERVHPALETMVAEGRYPYRSAAFYLDPQGSGPVLRHVGFLGAVAPEVKGLEPIKFSDGEFIAIEMKEDEVAEPNSEQIKKTVGEAITAWFAEKLGVSRAAAATFTEAEVQERIAQATRPLSEKLDALTVKFNEAVQKAEERAANAANEAQKERVRSFIESLKARNRWVPAFEEAGLAAVLEHLATHGGTVKFGEGDQQKEVSIAECFQTFLESLGEIVPRGEIAGGKATGRLVRFAEPGAGQEIDSASIALAERAEALEAEIRKEDPRLTPSAVAALALARARRELAAGAASAGSV